MALLEDFDKQGSFLFRWRSYIPGFILILSFFYVHESKYYENNYYSNLIITAVCFLVSLFGLFIRCFTIGFTPAKTSGRNTKTQVAETVNQTGIYSLIRHPLYVGNFFMFFGVVLNIKDLSLSLIFILFYWMYYERIMYTEEFFLRNKFGEDYLTWANQTPAILPKFQKYVSPNLAFSFKNILKREYPSFFGIIIIFLFYDLIFVYINEPIRIQNSFSDIFYPHHIYIFMGACLFYIMTRIVVKFTNWLVVEGR